MVKYWMHNGLMQRAGASAKLGGKSDRDATPETGEDAASKKISRSAGDGGLAQLIEQQTGDRIRFFLLRSQYRSTILYGDEALEEAGQALSAFYRLIERFDRLTGKSFYRDLNYARTREDGDAALAGKTEALLVELAKRRAAYLEKMDDDFNTGGAVSELFEMSRAINRFVDQENLEDSKKRTEAGLAVFSSAISVLRELGAILGLFIKPPKNKANEGSSELVDGLMELVIKLRADARAKKDFATSDTIRDGLAELAITLKDLKEGTTWEKA